MEGVKYCYQDEYNGELWNGNFIFFVVVCWGQLFNMCCQEQQEWSQYYDVQYFGDNCCVFCVWVDCMVGGNNLCYFMYGGVYIDFVGFWGKLVCQQWVYCWVEEDGDGIEDNYCGDGNCYFIGFGFDYWFGGEYGCCVVDVVVGVDQLVGVFIEIKYFLVKEVGDKKGIGECQNVN